MRTWRIAASFHRMADLVVTVHSPNWQAALRKAALEIKKLPEMKGRRLKGGSFMLQEIDPEPTTEQTGASEQLPLLPAEQGQPVEGPQKVVRMPETKVEPPKG